jgi:hypothetical protein
MEIREIWTKEEKDTKEKKEADCIVCEYGNISVWVHVINGSVALTVWGSKDINLNHERGAKLEIKPFGKI